MKPWGIQRPVGRSSEQKVSLTLTVAVFSQMAFSRKDGFGQGVENKRKRTCRRMEKFCGRFSLAGKEEIRSKTHNMRALLGQNVYNKSDPDRLPAPMWRTFLFFWAYEVIFMDTRVWSLPCSRFIHSFFRSKARASRNNSVRMLALPQVKKRRNPKSFFSRPKAPST